MDAWEALRGRRMVRHYTAEAVPPDIVFRIAGAVCHAPTAGHAQGVSVVIVDDPLVRQGIASAAGEPDRLTRGFEPWLSSAAALMALVASPELYRARYAEPDKNPTALTIPWWWVDAGAALMSLLVAARAEGLAAGFLGAHAVPGLDRLLGLDADSEPVGLVTVGHPAPDRRSSSLDRPRRQDIVRRLAGPSAE